MTDADDRPAQTILPTDLRGESEPAPKQTLRQRAEQIACDTAAQSPEALAALSPQDLQQIFHELRVHQIELQMQNEELRRAQAEITVAHARYFDLYELAPVGYCTLCKQGLIREANLTAATLLGLARGALTGQPMFRFILREDQQVFYLFRKSLFEAYCGSAADAESADGPRVCTLRIQKSDGAILWAQFAAIAVTDADGSPVCRVTISDLTLSKAVDALRDSEERLTLALDAAQLGIYDWDIAANRILWSQQHERLWGLAPGGFDGTYEGFLSRVHPDDVPGVAGEIARCMAARDRFSRNFRVIWPDGSLHWMQGLGEFSVDTTGKPQRMRGVVMEVTARKEEEQALRRFQQIVETSREMVMFIDRDLRYQVVNPAYAALFLAQPQALQGCRVSEVVGEDGYARIAPELQAALAGETRRFGFQITALDGRGLDLEATCSPFREQGSVQGIVVSLHDVTETQAARAALDAERAQLEDLVAQRTAALHASEGMLRTIYDLLPVGISITDRSGRIVDCNQASERLLGLTREEHLRRHYAGKQWAIIRPDGTPLPADAYASVRAMVEQRPVRNVEMGIVKPAGVTWLSVSATPTAHPDYGVVIAYVDITEARRTETALRTSKQQLDLALHAAAMGIWDWEIATGRVAWAGEHATLFGVAAADFGGTIEDVQACVHPDDREQGMAVFHRTVDEGTAFDNTYRVVWPDGSLHWLHSLGKLIRDDCGAPQRILGTTQDITASTLAEETLRRNQAILARTEAIAHVGSWEWDPATDTVTWSAELYRILQRDPAAGAPSFADHAQLYLPEDMQRLKCAVEAALTQGTPYELELRAIRRDGETVVLLTVGQVDIGTDKHVTRLFGSVQDVTERRAAERSLRDSEELFRAMFMNAPLSILIHDADTGEILDANPAACAQYECGSVEALKANFDQIWLEPPYSIEDAVKWNNKTLQKGPQEFEWCYRHAGGMLHWQWVHLSTLVMYGKVCILAMTVDVTKNKQIARELQASEGRARAIIDASPVPFALNDAQRNITYLNLAFIKLFGYTLADIPTLADWWPLAYPDPDYRQRVMDTWQERVAQARQDGERFAALPEVTIRCKNGQDRTLLIGASALGSAFDDLLLVNFYDITDLKQAREAAEQATRVKSAFLANMSHEIRTPLNAMLGLAQLLEGEALSAEQRHLVQRLRTAGRSLLGLVNDILDVSKLASGQLRLEVRTFAPASVLAQVASLLGQQARAKGLDFRLDTPADLASWLRGDPLRLEQILVNLVGNAVKFTERGGVHIQVSQQDADTRMVRLRLEVRDSGIGISPERLAILGTSFTQADGSITRRFGGTGLGLAISKQLVERMGGSFGVDSTLGLGSTFWCELPFERASANDAPPDEAAPAERPAGPRLSGVHCLVADDSPLNREVVERALRREGARATLVADGQRALDCLRAEPQDFDAVLMDIQMPVMDGLTATRAIRQALGLTDLPVIAFSAGVLVEQRQQAQAAGVSDFLAKPVDLEDLVAVLRRWTNPQPAVAPEAEGPVPSPSPGPAGFPDIPGIDRRRAARLLDQDGAFFLRLAHRFAADFADATQQTQQALARGEVIAATRRLHTLRGLAGNLGALELAQSAQALETALADPHADPAPALADFDVRLCALLTALVPWLERAAPVPDADPDAPLDEARLTALCDALSGDDLAALELFEALQPALAQRDGQAATQALAQMIRSLRFTEALARLAQTDQAESRRP